MQIKLDYEEIQDLAEQLEDILGDIYRSKTRVIVERDDYCVGLNTEDEPDLYDETENIIRREYAELSNESVEEIYDELFIPSLEERFRERIFEEYND